MHNNEIRLNGDRGETINVDNNNGFLVYKNVSCRYSSGIKSIRQTQPLTNDWIIVGILSYSDLE